MATLSPAFIAVALWVNADGLAAKSLHPDYQLMRGELQQYGDWLVGCDNNADCTIFGFPKNQSTAAVEDGAPTLAKMSIRISYLAQEGTPPVVEMFPVAEPADSCSRCISKSHAFRLSANGEQSQTLYSFAKVTPTQSETVFVLQAYKKGLTLAGVDQASRKVSVRFPAAQFKTALGSMQVRQAELKKKLASDAIGELPGGSIVPVAGQLKRIPAIETIVSGFVPILAEGRCRNDFMQNPRAYDFANGAKLWSFECKKGSGAPRTLWDMALQANAIATPLDLPEPRDRSIRAGVDGLEDYNFDWDFGILRSFQYLNGRKDCGTFRAWGYTQNGWYLLERREMPLCKGLSSENWIRTHYTPTDGAGPDE